MAASRVYLGVHYPSDILAGALLGDARRRGDSMKVGIVGMPNAGKSSLFNALTKAGAEAANYPFTTIEPNVAIVPVARRAPGAGRGDRRGPRRSSGTRSPSTTSPAWSRARRKGEGLGNKFLANIRETDAIVHVVRAHTDATVMHSEGSVDPMRDIETIETELIYADLEQAERRHERVVRDARGGDKARDRPRRRGCAASSRRCRRAGRSRTVAGAPTPAPNALRDLSPLTGKPVLFVANVDEGERRGAGRDRRARRGAAAPAPSRSPRAWRPSCPSSTTRRPRRCARISASASPAWTASSHGAFALLDLIAFFTAGEAQAAQSLAPAGAASPPGTRRARSTPTSRRASSAPRSSAGTRWSRPAATPARATRGTLRLEGRDYVMRDGDVITVKFTP